MNIEALIFEINSHRCIETVNITLPRIPVGGDFFYRKDTDQKYRVFSVVMNEVGAKISAIVYAFEAEIEDDEVSSLIADYT